MRKIILTDETELLYEDEYPDMTDFNEDMLIKGFDKIKEFHVYSKGYQIKVDLINADIEIDGQLIDLEVDAETKTKLKANQLKWINFRRVRKSFRMAGNISITTKYGVGFQATVDGENIKRFVLLDRGKQELIKE